VLTVDDLPLLATPKQTAEVMGLTEAQVRRLVRLGKLAHVMVGARALIPAKQSKSSSSGTPR
jgi:excisionase family DNA binding protein